MSDRAQRALWTAVFVLVAVAVVVAIAAQAAPPAPTQTGWGVGGIPGRVVSLVVDLSHPLVGWAILRSRPRNTIGRLLLAIGAANAFTELTTAYVHWALVVHPGSLPGGALVQAISGADFILPIGLTGVFLILLYPDGRLLSRRVRPLAWICGAVLVLSFVAVLVRPGGSPDAEVPSAPNPLELPALAGHDTMSGGAFGVVACALASVVVATLRFRRSRGVERLQLKWLAAAGVLAVCAAGAAVVASAPAQVAGLPPTPLAVVLQTVDVVSFVGFPVAVWIAVTRHGLYGIDRLISRALVVGVLGLFITGVYVAIVVGIGALVGRTAPSVALSVAATAVVAVAFQPVRERVQRLARRLVYGERATPYEVLSDFASRMAGTYTTAELLPRLAETLGRSLGGARVEVWTEGASAPAASWPSDPASSGPSDRTVEVRHQGEPLGRLTVTKRAGEPVTAAEDAFLGDVASQAGLVLRNVRLLDDLRGSRERLVAANDIARRRLERDLHDGARATLTAVRRHLADAAAYDDGHGAGPMVEEAADQLRHATEELAELARGLHPAVLTERGLGPALHALADRSPIPVTVDVAPVPHLAEPVEVTLYFAAAEALTNVAKYAAAGRVDLSLAVEDGALTLTVTDDGTGGADPARGSGLRGLTDRVTAVGGTLDVHSPSGHGTRVTCRVPATAVGPATVAVLEAVS